MLTALCARRALFRLLAVHSSRPAARPQLGKRRSHVLREHGRDDWRATEMLMIRTGLTAIAVAMCFGGSVLAQQQQPPAAPPPVDFSEVEIKTTDIGDGVDMLEVQ